MRPRPTIGTALAVLLVAGSVAVGEPARGSATPPGQSEAMSTETSPPAPEEFAESVATGNRFAIETGRIAVDRARAGPVRAFARRTVSDHEQMQRDLDSSAAVGEPASPALDAPRADLVSALASASAEEFDALYVDSQIQACEREVAMFFAYAREGRDPALRAFAERALPGAEARRTAARALRGG